jgi:hypothetical protein
MSLDCLTTDRGHRQRCRRCSGRRDEKLHKLSIRVTDDSFVVATARNPARHPGQDWNRENRPRHPVQRIMLPGHSGFVAEILAEAFRGSAAEGAFASGALLDGDKEWRSRPAYETRSTECRCCGCSGRLEFRKASRRHARGHCAGFFPEPSLARCRNGAAD